MSSKKNRSSQSGSVLVMTLIMLIVVTLLAVYAIRSGNTNLLISGNMQTQVEATAITQQAIDTVVADIRLPGVDISTYTPAQVTTTVNGKSYTTTPSVGTCILEVPIMNADLDTTKADDVACLSGGQFDGAIRSDGKLTTRPSACKSQQWEVRAQVSDTSSGASVTVVQGVSVRVNSVTTCL